MQTRPFLLIVLLFVTTTSFSWIEAQSNFGLTAPQDPSTLPKSATVPEKPVRKAKVKATTQLQSVSGGAVGQALQHCDQQGSDRR